jgi:hypothetical protein
LSFFVNCEANARRFAVCDDVEKTRADSASQCVPTDAAVALLPPPIIIIIIIIIVCVDGSTQFLSLSLSLSPVVTRFIANISRTIAPNNGRFVGCSSQQRSINRAYSSLINYEMVC